MKASETPSETQVATGKQQLSPKNALPRRARRASLISGRRCAPWSVSVVCSPAATAVPDVKNAEKRFGRHLRAMSEQDHIVSRPLLDANSKSELELARRRVIDNQKVRRKKIATWIVSTEPDQCPTATTCQLGQCNSETARSAETNSKFGNLLAANNKGEWTVCCRCEERCF